MRNREIPEFGAQVPERDRGGGQKHGWVGWSRKFSTAAAQILYKEQSVCRRSANKPDSGQGKARRRMIGGLGRGVHRPVPKPGPQPIAGKRRSAALPASSRASAPRPGPAPISAVLASRAGGAQTCRPLSRYQRRFALVAPGCSLLPQLSLPPSVRWCVRSTAVTSCWA